MSFPRDAYPYTNFHELNLGYFIIHFREIFSQWADLYDQMTDWKDATDEELTTWKAGVEADLDQREAALRAELETWKAQTGQDIAGWEDATLAALTAWQTATQAVFEAIRVEAAGSASAAAASAGDAATAKTAAETAQAAAEAAAASIASSAAQIATNTADISDLKTQILFVTGTEAIEIPAANQGKYLHIINNVIDVNNPATSSAGYGYVIVPCSEGEVFTVSGVSSNTEPMAWAFTDGNYAIKEKAGNSRTITDAVITAPSGSAYLVIHDKSPYRLSYKGVSLVPTRDEVKSLHTFYPIIARNGSWANAGNTDVITIGRFNIPEKAYEISLETDRPTDGENGYYTLGYVFLSTTVGSGSYTSTGIISQKSYEVSPVYGFGDRIKVPDGAKTVVFTIAQYNSDDSVEPLRKEAFNSYRIRLMDYENPDLEIIKTFTDIPYSKTDTRINSLGTAVASENDKATELIECHYGEKIEWYGKSFWYQNSSVMCCLAFYDNTKTLLSSFTQVDGSEATTNKIGKIVTTVPVGAAYVAASSHVVDTVTPYLKLYDVLDKINSTGDKLNQYNDVEFSNKDHRYNYSNKQIVGSTDAAMTEYIPCFEGDVVKYEGRSFYYEDVPVMYCVAFLASDYSFISGVEQVSEYPSAIASKHGTIDVVAPEGTAYVVASTSAANNYSHYLHIYSYRRKLEEDTDKRTKRLETVKRIRMARQVSGNSVTVGNKCISFLHFSDLHADKKALKRIMADRAFYGKYIADAICTGDLCMDTYDETFGEWWDERALAVIGNHDVASRSGSTYDWTYLSMADRTGLYIEPFVSTWGVQHVSGKSYYYKDYDGDAKVRLIVVDNMLYNLSGTEADDQETWLSNLLDDAITNGYHVLIACHAPHGSTDSTKTSVAIDCSFSSVNGRTMPQYNDCNTPQSLIDLVSQKITGGLIFVGYLVGHLHRDYIFDASRDAISGKKQLMYDVTTAAVYSRSFWMESDMYRDNTLDAYNIVTIDTEHKLVKIVRGGGADMDNYMRPRRMICIDYATGTVVGEEK